MMISSPASAATFAGGDGTVADPYQISTVEQLQDMSTDLSANYILINDIDASVTSGWNGNAGFTPIGDLDNQFTGTFDGDGFVITGLYINRPTTDDVGLFGYVDSVAVVKNIGLEDVSITGHYEVGGLAGMNDGFVTQSYSTGNISGDLSVGGLVGSNFGSIYQSYSMSNVTGSDYVGGLAGDNRYFDPDYGTINESYSTGYVTGNNYLGGLVGENDYTVTNSYWDTQTSGQVTSGGGTGKTTSQMEDQSTYVGWNFTSEWAIDGITNNGYPFLRTFSEPVSFFAGGDGSAGNPYQISTVEQLQNMSTDLSANYTLINDIDASETIELGGGFDPIGYDSEDPSIQFSGTLDGNGYEINDLYIYRPTEDYVGLFGWATNEAVIRNIGLVNVNITGKYCTGALAGLNIGEINQSSAIGNVTGTYTYTGGLIGANAGNITSSSFNGNVSSEDYYVGGITAYNEGNILLSYSGGNVIGFVDIGGFVGWNVGGIINQSYSTCNVTGGGTDSRAGGLVGNLGGGSVDRSYSTGFVTGAGSNVGGLVGANFELPVTNSYWNNVTSGQTTSSGGEGRNTADMKKQSTFVGWDFTSVWAIGGTTNNGYPYLLNSPAEFVPKPPMTSLFAVPLNETDFTFSSSDFVEGINVEFNTSMDNVDLTLMSTMNIVKLTGALDNDVWVRIYVDGAPEPVLEEKMRSLSKDKSNIDEGSTGTRPISFTIPSSGTHNITYEFNRTGNGAVEVNDIDITLLKFVTAEGNQVRDQLTDVSYSHSSTTFDDAFNWSVEKSVESGTFVIGKYSLSSDLETALQYYYQDLNSVDISTSWSRHLEDGSDTGSVSGIFVDRNEEMNKNYSLFSRNIADAATTNVVGKVLDFDLGDLEGYEVSSFSVSNESTDTSSNKKLGPGTHLLATESMTVYNGTGYFLAMTSSFSSASGSQTPTYFINCTQVPDCYSKKERFLMSNDDIGNAFIYYTTDDLTPGVTYDFNLWVTVEDGEELVQIDEVLAGFEISEFDITSINTAPHVAIIAPEPDANISGTFYVNASVTDNNGDAFLSNVSLSNITGNVLSYEGLFQNNLSVDIDSTQFADGSYNIIWEACENESAEKFCAIDVIDVTIDNNAPFIDFNDETTDEGNFSQNYIVGNISVSDVSLNASAIYLYNETGLKDSSISSDLTHSVNFTSLADGYYQLNASAWDIAGNIKYTETRAILLDTTDPVIVFNEDTTAEGNFSQTSIFANVTSFDVFGYSSLTISLYNESSLVDSSTTEGNGNLSNEFTGLADGVYYLNATVVDLAGNTNTTSTLEITLDTVKPAIDFNDETTDEGNFSQSYIVGNISVSDMWLNASGIYLYNSSGVVDSSISSDPTYSVTFSGLADGYYQLNASVWDYAGNTNETETRSILLDTTDPVIVFNDDVLPSGNFSQDWVFANVTASDNMGIRNVTIYLYNSTGLFNSTSYPGSLSVNFTSLPSGMYYLNATIEDLGGNIVPIGPIAYGIDAIDMEITNVTASQVTDRSATISWKTNEAANSTVYYGLDSNVSMNISKAVFGTDHSIMLTGLQDETLYYYKVVSYDIFGFNNSSLISNFTTVKTSTVGGSSDDDGLPNYYYFQDLKEKQENEAACSALEASGEFDVGHVMSGDTVEIDTLEQLRNAGCMVTGVDINLGRDVDDMDVTITQSSSSS
ncbi:hypothetical protein LI82_07855 [Methanococcoides methylutens]|uniref:Fibronectin type-III domain-containing protein n=1 Tax=Methanococcoides methylutens TaxID=2226 RepID=A0A099SYH9_METMT|nr:Ig-like domain-containing protein [Methanococcoides methylutens]KGK97689.1 hypothetical protein LI82_07855 [Methanococcoides methylutens]